MTMRPDSPESAKASSSMMLRLSGKITASSHSTWLGENKRERQRREEMTLCFIIFSKWMIPLFCYPEHSLYKNHFIMIWLFCGLLPEDFWRRPRRGDRAVFPGKRADDSSVAGPIRAARGIVKAAFLWYDISYFYLRCAALLGPIQKGRRFSWPGKTGSPPPRC